MRIECISKILDKTPPMVFLTSECRQLGSILSGVNEAQRGLVWNLFKTRFKETADSFFRELISEESADLLSMVAAARCLDTIGWKEPTVANISDLSRLNRNLVAGMARTLAPIGLVSIAYRGQREHIRPTALCDFFNDLVVGTTRLLSSCSGEVLDQLRSGAINPVSVERLELVEAAMGLVKRMYGENTLNRQIYNALHDRTIELIAALRSGRTSEAKVLLERVLEDFKVLEEPTRKAQELGVLPLILEDTGERIGRAKIYRPARKRS